jgi:predicted Rossmann fold nucleotide-binding protein DprA/Smf involved in DNA uptake
MGESTSSLSAGTNALLRLGAIPATCAGDVLELFDLLPVRAPHADLGASARAVLDLLGDSARTADEIAQAAGIDSHGRPRLGLSHPCIDGTYRSTI